MSLVSSYVQSRKGIWYRNPVVGEADWFICWDDEDPIELVVKVPGPTVAVILKLMAQLGWHLRVIGKGLTGERVFGEGWEFHPAVSVFLKQTHGGFPDDRLLRGDKLVARPRGQGVYFERRP